MAEKGHHINDHYFVVYEDRGVELQESGRLRDRGVAKKDRVDRKREREWSSRSKRRTKIRMMIRKRCLKQTKTQSTVDPSSGCGYEIVKEEVENCEKSMDWKETIVNSFSRMDKDITEWSNSASRSNCRCELQTAQCDAVRSTVALLW
ncbi:hypothetical protein L1887_18291 [Cichorium endivia]|nr:hypothetical protein L1887_18291 [Cichorium endivia]